MKNNFLSAINFFARTTNNDDKICVAAAVAGMAMCEEDKNKRNSILNEAEKKFLNIKYYRGALKCKRLLDRDPLNFEAWEIPDALL